MRADSWNRALKHWIKVHNDLPRLAHWYSPNAIMDNTHQIDARYQYRFANGYIVCYQVSEKEPLTFTFMMQIAIAMGLKWCTADIKAAYPNVPRPAGEIPMLTKLELFVVEICEMDPNQLYRIEKCLYGLPDSGRHFTS